MFFFIKAEVSNEIKRKETNVKVSIESSHDINNNENIKNDPLINQQGTIIFENGHSCLQFHLNPEINPSNFKLQHTSLLII